jgi:hypothetical protein
MPTTAFPHRCGAIIAAIVSPLALISQSHAELVYGMASNQTLVTWESAAPNDLLSGVAVQGLQSNETIHGIDFRPATGELYALGSFSHIYTIDVVTGIATEVGAPGAFSPLLNGSSFGFDFNPTVDRIRVVSNADQNLRLNPMTGDVAAVDGMLAYNAGDANFGVDPSVIASAYTNSFAGALTTTLYGIDSFTDSLVIQNPPNSGGLMTVGSIGADITDLAAFDISGASGIAYASIVNSTMSQTTFWTIDLSNGQGTMIGEVDGGVVITAMTVVPSPGAALLLAGAAMTASRRRRAS